MNKTFSILLIVLAMALIAYNVTLLNFSTTLEGDRTVAFIGIIA